MSPPLMQNGAPFGGVGHSGAGAASSVMHTTEPCPRSHLLKTSCLPPALVSRLREFAQVAVGEKLITRAKEMSINAPMGNEPRAEVLLNTKIAEQYSRSGNQGTESHECPIERQCALCEQRAAEYQSSVGGTRPGAAKEDNPCEKAGGQFICPTCNVLYTKRWAYETGTGRSSIGRNPEQFKVLPFTPEMCMMANIWESETGQEYNNVVLVAYCGANMCASCACGLDHGSVVCGSVLGMHQDNAQKGGAGNSQASQSVNRTLNVGHPRTLRMALVRHLGGNCSNEVRNTEVEFTLHDGSEFVLDTRDEVEEERQTLSGRIRCSWEHGMIEQIGCANISCGYVGRHVCKLRDVDLSSDLVINARHDKWIESEQCLMYRRAQNLWQSLSEQYIRMVEPHVRAALCNWPNQGRHARRAVTRGGGSGAV